MRFEEFFFVLKKIKFLVVYYYFEEGYSLSLFFMVYLVMDLDNFGVDNWVYYKVINVQIEFYMIKKDLVIEKMVELVFDVYCFYFDKVEIYIISEKFY